MTRLVGAEVLCVLLLLASRCGAVFGSELTEGYFKVPMPPHFSVQSTDIDGPVFADGSGRTLYRWPLKNLAVGIAGEAEGQINCTDVKTTESAGYMEPYPAGFMLPDLDTRPSCSQEWPPAIASSRAKPIGRWTLIKRKDGANQWAYDGFALYTSVLDHERGEVNGLNVTHRNFRDDAPAAREPIKPPTDMPYGFSVATVRVGRLLSDQRGYSVYSSDGDGPEKSNCKLECARIWSPMLAAATAHAHGAWSIFERSPGVRQWAYRKKPLYQYTLDTYERSLQGSDEPGWHNVLLQAAPPPPEQFTVQDTTAGQVLADAHGKTLYIYTCTDDSVDQLSCDHPTETQTYRLAMCGGGDAERCVRTFPYVAAEKGAKVHSRSWSTVDIDPMTGRLGKAGAAGVQRVWAYRGRPVYTYAGDSEPGDINAEARGELQGERNGFNAFWLREDFFQRAG